MGWPCGGVRSSRLSFSPCKVGGMPKSELTSKHRGEVFAKLACSNFIATSSVLIRRKLFLTQGGFKESLCSIEDWDLWLRLASAHPLGYLDEPLLRYRVHARSSSRQTRLTLPNHLAVINDTFANDSIIGRLRHLEPIAKASSYSICSQIAEEEEDYGFALKCAIFALLHSPAKRERWRRVANSLIKYAVTQFGYKLSLIMWWVYSTTTPA